MLKHTSNTNNSGKSLFMSRFTMNNTAPKLQKCWTHTVAFEIIPKMPEQPNFFCCQPSTLPKFYLSATFGLSFMISSVAPSRSSISYTYLLTNIGKQHYVTAKFNEITLHNVYTAHRGKFSTISLSTAGYIMSTPGDVQYTGVSIQIQLFSQ